MALYTVNGLYNVAKRIESVTSNPLYDITKKRRDKMELILTVDVKVDDAYGVEGVTRNVYMIDFHGTASGPYFNGEVIGSGVDTQKQSKDGVTRLSARYMLEGTDMENQKCHVFIENNSNDEGGFTPIIVTDSKALAKWETTKLSAQIEPQDGGVIVKIYA